MSGDLFTQQDTWMGINSDPITLHKYLYSPSDPANFVDPSGNSFLGEVSAAINIQSVLAATAIVAVGFSSVDLSSTNTTIDIGFSAKQSNLVLLAAMAGAGSKLLTLVTSKLAEDSSGRVLMYHGSSLASLVALLNGAPLSAASAMEQKFPGEEGTLLGFYLTPDLLAAEFFGQRRGGGAIQFAFTYSAFNAIRAGSTVRPIAPIGSSNQSPGAEMIVQPVIFPLFDSLRKSGQITATPAP